MKTTLSMLALLSATLAGAQTYELLSMTPRIVGESEGSITFYPDAVAAHVSSIISHPSGIETRTSRSKATVEWVITVRVYTGKKFVKTFKSSAAFTVRQSSQVTTSTYNMYNTGSVRTSAYIGGIESAEVFANTWGTYWTDFAHADTLPQVTEMTFYSSTQNDGYAYATSVITFPPLIAETKAFIVDGGEQSGCYVTADNMLGIVWGAWSDGGVWGTSTTPPRRERL